MKKLLLNTVATIKILFKVLLRLILFILSLLGISSAYLLSMWEINNSFSEEKFNAGLEKDCGVRPLEYDPAYGMCWEDWQRGAGGGAGLVVFICIIFIIIGIPSIIFLYKLLKKDFIQLRLKYRK
jgi:hypothetical protein